ncbi:MAG TPA: c-type cytochrome biogenesis protein CcmI [Reyranella sp.]|nr:c-type cytochrome biogenesis protein CcmI [Reyranella sp.]
MLEFLLALLTTATVAALLVPLLRPRPGEPTKRLDNDLAIYRDQLAEIERERAQGLVSAAEAQQASTEIQRRLLAAADKDTAVPHAAASALHRYLPPALCLLIPLFALGVYLQIGRPGLPASPFASHRVSPSQNPGGPQAEPDYPALIAEMKERIARNPQDADALSSLGELLVMQAAQGSGIATVGEPALDAFNKALALKPDDPRAGYYVGLHEAESGDSQAAIRRWQKLAAAAPADAPWLTMLNQEIVRVAKAANLPVPELRTPAKPSGPTREQVEQMQKLSPEERQQAIRGMVEGLAARLKESPNDRDGWLRLAQARKVLGEAAASAEAYARADKLAPLDAGQLADWAEALVRQLPPGGAPGPEAVAVLTRLEQAEPRNALALFYLGAADLAAGRKQDAARRWKMLLEMLPSDAPIRAMLEAKLKETQ